LSSGQHGALQGRQRFVLVAEMLSWAHRQCGIREACCKEVEGVRIRPREPTKTTIGDEGNG
jgi:hypothetical protein